MPKVSVIIPTFNRPDLLPRAIRSVLDQTFTDLDVIVVDDGDKVFAEDIVRGFNDSRMRYIKNNPPKQGGGRARNVGIKEAQGEYVAFLDDDDEWVSEKLEKQVRVMDSASGDVGFCFTGTRNRRTGGESANVVAPGVRDYAEISLLRFKGFLTSTLLFRRTVLTDVGFFDEELPSHQEAELIIRVALRYKGFGINEPLVVMDMTDHDHIGGDLSRRIRGKELLLSKHEALYRRSPQSWGKQLFWLALWYRESGNTRMAAQSFFRAFRITGNPRYLFHGVVCYCRSLSV